MEGKGFFDLTGDSPSWRKARLGTQAETRRKELKQRSWRNSGYWLAPRVIYSRLSHITHALLPIDGTIHSEMFPHPPIGNKKKSLIDMHIGQSVGDNYSVEVSLFLGMSS